jgi:hypothetical protein
MAFSDNINGYTRDELFQLSNDDLRNVSERGWQRGPDGKPVSPEDFSRLAKGAFGIDDKAAFQEIREAEAAYSLAPPAPPQASNDPYAATAWGTPDEYDFVVPSGQRCLIRKIDTERLVASGILSKVTRLSGLVQKGIEQTQGKPPTPDSMAVILEDPAKAQEVIGVINTLVATVVVKPQLYIPVTGQAAPAGAVDINRVDLADRIAILEEAMRGVSKLDNFRN